MATLGKKLRRLVNRREDGNVKKSVKVPKTNMDAVKRMRAKLKNVGGGDNKWWKPAEGINIIRILPSNVAEHAGIPAGGFSFHSCLHYGFRDQTGGRAYPCLDHIEQPPCPVCKFISKYSGETDPDVVKLLRNIKPSSQFLMNIIDRSSKVPRVQIWSAPPGVSKDIVKHMSDPDYGDITDAEEGFDLKLEKEVNKGRTSYNVTPRRQASEIGLEGWQTQLFDLATEAYREIPTYQQYIEMMEQQFSDFGFDWDFLKKKPLKSAKKVKPEPEAEELDTDDDDDDEDEED